LRPAAQASLLAHWGLSLSERVLWAARKQAKPPLPKWLRSGEMSSSCVHVLLCWN
jgi:hypothetical protein